MKVSIIGVGRLGGALALALAKKGYSIENLVARQPETAEKIARNIQPQPRILTAPETTKLAGSEIIFITVQDSEIERVAAGLAGNLTAKPFVFHTSGSLSSRVLRALSESGCPVGSIHPLVSVSDSFLGAEKFRDVFFCLEGERRAVTLAEKIVGDLEGKPFTVETKFKTLYHASAVMASGHVTALISIAVEMLAACGLDAEKSRAVLLPLVKSTFENLEKQTPAQALTGTFARADAETMQKHLAAIREAVAPELLEVYLQLGLRSAHLAGMHGAKAESLARMKKILEAESAEIFEKKINRE
ncbi:MAG TPA: Rossmann-like and DUF2520 domain-containing protein [Pyrinomonadaceae bacterium]|nr:Rossmann-like and DUF2520 domain-containing protein [Pyrinomonadaceae bacterium]